METAPRPSSPKPPVCRRSLGRVSGMKSAMPITMSAQNTARKKKAERQEFVRSSRTPPTIGPTSGAIIVMLISTEKNRAASGPFTMSAATARPITMPPPPRMPNTKREPMRKPIDGAKAQAKVAKIVTIDVMSTRRRRPKESDIGPKTSWPIMMPRNEAVSVS